MKKKGIWEMNLLKNVNVSYGKALVAAANNTDDNSAILDMSGYDGVMFIAPIYDSVSGGVATLTVEANTANSDSGMAAVTGAAATVTSGANDDLNGGCLIVDVYKPQKRYVQAVRTSSTQNIAFDALIAIRYHGKKRPVTQGATVLASTQVAG
jgi:hypothetical protein